MGLMFERKKEEEHEDDPHKPEGEDEGKGGNLGSFFLDIAKSPAKYVLFGGLVVSLIFLLTKVRVSHKNRNGVGI